jgi:hypothetical protein
MEHFPFLDNLVRLSYDFLTAFVIIRYVYYPKERKREYLLTFFVFNLVIFFVCTFLKHILMDIGFAFGLFAVFSILRYRTESIPIREMTYQFLVITLGALNGLADVGTWHPELVFINLVILAMVLVLDGRAQVKEGFTQAIRYEKIDLVRADRRAELVADLKARTGLDIYRFEIRRIDFLNDSAEIVVFYHGGRDAFRAGAADGSALSQGGRS